MANIYDIMRAKAKSMGHAAAKLPDDVYEKVLNQQDKYKTLNKAKLYVESYMMGDLEPSDFARIMADDDRLRYTISDLCRMRLDPDVLNAQEKIQENFMARMANGSYVDIGAGLKTFWTEIRVPLPSEIEAARDIRNITFGIEAGKNAGQKPAEKGSEVSDEVQETPKKRSFREIFNDAKKRAAEKAIEKLTPIAEDGKQQESRYDEAWLETDEGREYRAEVTRKAAQQIENVAMNVEAGKDTNLHPDERKKAFAAAGMSEEDINELVLDGDYREYGRKIEKYMAQTGTNIEDINLKFYVQSEDEKLSQKAEQDVKDIENALAEEWEQNGKFEEMPLSIAELENSTTPISAEDYYKHVYKNYLMQKDDLNVPEDARVTEEGLQSWRDILLWDREQREKDAQLNQKTEQGVEAIENALAEEWKQNGKFKEMPLSLTELENSTESISTEDYYKHVYKNYLMQKDNSDVPEKDRITEEGLQNWRDLLLWEREQAGQQESQAEQNTAEEQEPVFKSGYSEEELNLPLNDDMQALFDQMMTHVKQERRSYKPYTDNQKYDNTRKPNAQEYGSGRNGVYDLFNQKSKMRQEKIHGIFEGKEVSFKNSWRGHTFTEEEAGKLLAGETISIDYTDNKNEAKTVPGKLEWQTYNGHEYLGFKADFSKQENTNEQASLFNASDEELMNYYMGAGSEQGEESMDDYYARLAGDMENDQDEEGSIELSAEDCAILYNEGMQM